MKNPREVTKADVVRMVVIGVIVTALGIALGLAIDWFPNDASTQMKSISAYYDFLIVLSVPVFVLVATIVLFSVVRFRMRPGEEELDGPPTHGNTRVEIIWTAIPSIIVAALCVYAVNVLSDIDSADANQVKITAYGQQFAWQFEYTSPTGKKFLDDELYIECTPTGAQTGQGAGCKGPQVAFDIKAVDVIHSLWLPSMAMKQDAVPGITTHTKINPTKLGMYPVVCTELCGIGHGIMRSTVHVLTPAQYAAWLKAKNKLSAG